MTTETTEIGLTGVFDGIAAEFSPELLDDTACRVLVIATLHGDLSECPTCRSSVAPSALHKFRAGQRIRCRSCGRSMSYTSGTALDGLHITPAELVLFVFLTGQGLRTQAIADILRRDRGTINNWRQRLIAIDLPR